MRPHRQRPTRLPCPWDSPGKNTGVGCHFLLQGMKVKNESEVTQSCLTPSDPMDCSLPGSSVHGIFQARVLEWGAIAFSREAILDLSNAAKIPQFLHSVLLHSKSFNNFQTPSQDKRVSSTSFKTGHEVLVWCLQVVCRGWSKKVLRHLLPKHSLVL